MLGIPPLTTLLPMLLTAALAAATPDATNPTHVPNYWQLNYLPMYSHIGALRPSEKRISACFFTSTYAVDPFRHVSADSEFLERVQQKSSPSEPEPSVGHRSGVRQSLQRLSVLSDESSVAESGNVPVPRAVPRARSAFAEQNQVGGQGAAANLERPPLVPVLDNGGAVKVVMIVSEPWGNEPVVNARYPFQVWRKVNLAMEVLVQRSKADGSAERRIVTRRYKLDEFEQHWAETVPFLVSPTLNGFPTLYVDPQPLVGVPTAWTTRADGPFENKPECRLNHLRNVFQFTLTLPEGMFDVERLDEPIAPTERILAARVRVAMDFDHAWSASLEDQYSALSGWIPVVMQGNLPPAPAPPAVLTLSDSDSCTDCSSTLSTTSSPTRQDAGKLPFGLLKGPSSLSRSFPLWEYLTRLLYQHQEASQPNLWTSVVAGEALYARVPHTFRGQMWRAALLRAIQHRAKQNRATHLNYEGYVRLLKKILRKECDGGPCAGQFPGADTINSHALLFRPGSCTEPHCFSLADSRRRFRRVASAFVELSHRQYQPAYSPIIWSLVQHIEFEDDAFRMLVALLYSPGAVRIVNMAKVDPGKTADSRGLSPFHEDLVSRLVRYVPTRHLLSLKSKPEQAGSREASLLEAMAFYGFRADALPDGTLILYRLMDVLVSKWADAYAPAPDRWIRGDMTRRV